MDFGILNALYVCRSSGSKSFDTSIVGITLGPRITLKYSLHFNVGKASNEDNSKVGKELHLQCLSQEHGFWTL